MTDSRSFTTPSPARLHAAAARAVREGIELERVAGTSRWIATNPTRGSRYTLLVRDDGTVTCECVAGMTGGICKHAAHLRRFLGALPPLPPPEPVELKPDPRELFPDRPMDGYDLWQFAEQWQPAVLAEHEREAQRRRRVAGE